MQIASQHGKKLVVLEIGAGFNTPGVIRLPCEQFVRSGGAQARLIRVNLMHPQVRSIFKHRCF